MAQNAPIIKVDKRPVGDGKAGLMTNKSKDLYLSICRGENPKYDKWLTPVYGTASSTTEKSQKVAAR